MTISSAMNKLDNRISNAPNTAVKYSLNSGDLLLMRWEDRADLEYFLLKYDVDKNSATGNNTEGLRKMLDTKSIMGGYSYKKDGLTGLLSIIISILVVICLVFFLACIIIIFVLFIIQMPEEIKPFQRYISATVLCILIIVILVYFFNQGFSRIIFAQETL